MEPPQVPKLEIRLKRAGVDPSDHRSANANPVLRIDGLDWLELKRKARGDEIHGV
jgi:hypothetical protein